MRGAPPSSLAARSSLSLFRSLPPSGGGRDTPVRTYLYNNNIKHHYYINNRRRGTLPRGADAVRRGQWVRAAGRVAVAARGYRMPIIIL